MIIDFKITRVSQLLLLYNFSAFSQKLRFTSLFLLLFLFKLIKSFVSSASLYFSKFVSCFATFEDVLHIQSCEVPMKVPAAIKVSETYDTMASLSLHVV